MESDGRDGAKGSESLRDSERDHPAQDRPHLLFDISQQGSRVQMAGQAGLPRWSMEASRASAPDAGSHEPSYVRSPPSRQVGRAIDRRHPRESPIFSLARPFPEQVYQERAHRRSPREARQRVTRGQVDLGRRSSEGFDRSAATSTLSTPLQSPRLSPADRQASSMSIPQVLLNAGARRRINASGASTPTRAASQQHQPMLATYHSEPNLLVLAGAQADLCASPLMASRPTSARDPSSDEKSRADDVTLGPRADRRPTFADVEPDPGEPCLRNAKDDIDEQEFPNPWAKIRYICREPFAEFLGTMILIIFGTGVNAQVILSDRRYGEFLSISFGWGIGVAMGVYASGGISGGHLNPVVTLVLAVFRGFPWKKVPGYILAQLLGAMVGALIIFGNYINAIRAFEGGPDLTVNGAPGASARATASIFTTFPAAVVADSPGSWFASEFLDSAVLIIVVFAIGDAGNCPPPAGMNALVLLFLIVGIGASLGINTSYAISPARDLGPRLACYMVGYGNDLWTVYSAYWAWVPLVATVLGGMFGGFLYDGLISTSDESPLNWRWTWLGGRGRSGRWRSRRHSGTLELKMPAEVKEGEEKEKEKGAACTPAEATGDKESQRRCPSVQWREEAEGSERDLERACS